MKYVKKAGLGQPGHQVETAKSRPCEQAQQDVLVDDADLLLVLLQQHLQLKPQFTSNSQVGGNRAWLFHSKLWNTYCLFDSFAHV